MAARMSTMALLRSHERVEIVDDERSMGNSIIVTLRQGWTFSPGEDNRVSGEDTVRDALAMVKAAHAFAGPYTN